MEKIMSTQNAYKKNAIIVGFLFIIATAFLFIGEAFYGPILNAPGFLETAYPNRITATIGILVEFTCVLAIPLIPVFVFPFLKRFIEPLAIGYVVFRLFEAVLFVIVDINKLSLINVSQGYSAGGVDAAFFRNMGSFVQAWNMWGWVFYVFVFAIGALIFYTALYQSKLVPRWISGWGWIAAILIMISALLATLEVNLPETLFGLLVLPIAVQEMVMALWLIIKGFNTSTLDAEVAK